MDRAKRIAEYLRQIYNIKSEVNIQLDFNMNDEYVYKISFAMYVLGARVTIMVELLSYDVDFEKSYKKLLLDASAQVQAQLVFIIV